MTQQPRVAIEVVMGSKLGPPSPKIYADVGSNWLAQCLFRMLVRMHYYREWYRFEREGIPGVGNELYGPARVVAITRVALNSTLAWAATEAEKLTGNAQEITPSFAEAGDPDWTDS